MKCKELISFLQSHFPESIACSWDNSGLTIGKENSEIRKVVVTVDITSAVIRYAIQEKAELILSHHPLIFQGIRQITDRDVFGSRILQLIENQIGVYAMHTNYDAAKKGMAYQAGKLLSLEHTHFLADPVSYIDSEGNMEEGGIGVIGDLPESMELSVLYQKVKDAFLLPSMICYHSDFCKKQIQRIAILPGSGKDYIREALLQGAELYISGDIGHHAGLDAAEQGLTVLDAGHYGIEKLFVPHMVRLLTENLSEKIQLLPFYPAPCEYI